MKTTLLVVAIAAGIALAGSAQAREGNGQRMDAPAFSDVDANADGGVTLQEIQAAMEARKDARFAQTDTNGDGALSAEEMIAMADTNRQERMASRIAEHIERADTNGDGMLQADEVAAQGEGRRAPNPERMFERLDDNDDGTLSEAEFAKMGEGRRDRGDRGSRNDN